MKNELRKMLSLVLAVVIAMSAISINTLAATIMDIANGSTNKLYVDWYSYSYNFNGRLNTSTYGQIIKLNVGSSTGQVAYCIQSSKDAWSSNYTAQKTYNLLSLTQQQNLKHALIYGYQGTTKYGYNADTERIATQIVIWNICDGWFNNSSESTAVGIFTEGMSSSMASNVKACYNKIKEQMLSHLTIPSYAVKPTVTNVPKQKMTTNSDGTFTITLTDSKNVSKYYDWQTAIKKYSYLSITTDTEGKLVIKSTKAIPSNSAITLTAKRDSNKYQNNIVDVAPMYMISGSGSQSSATFVQDYDPSEAKIAIYSDSLGTAQIRKVWQHNNDSSSTKADYNDIYFTIKNSAGTAIKGTGSAGSYTYSASGSVTKFKLNSSNTFSLKSLPAGDYTVSEYGTDGAGIPYYTRSNLSKTVTVTAGGTGTVTFTNTRNTGTGEVVKTWVDTNGNTISTNSSTSKNQQIYFRIKNTDGKYITVSGTKYSGTYSFTGTSSTATSLYVNPGTGKFSVSDLPTGKYTVYEYGSPDGYTVNKASQTITISSGKTASISFVNSEDSGTAQIKKVWLSDATLTATEIANLEKNVYFTVKNADGAYIKVTGSAGSYVYAGTQTTANSLKLSGSKFNISKLPLGKYSVTEINNVSGYTPKSQTKTVTIANKGETKSVSFTNKSTPVVVIRKHFSDEDNLSAAELKAQYAKVTVNLQVLGFTGKVQTNPPAGYYVEFTGSNGNYTYKGISATKTSAADLKLNDNGEITISFGTNTAPYYLSVIESYSGTEYSIDSRDQRIDLGNGDPNAVIDLDDIDINNNLLPGSVQIDKEFLNENGNTENITDEQLAEVSFKIMHNGKYLTFTGSNGSYKYKGENNTGTALKLNTSTYNILATGLPAREQYTVTEVSGATGYSFSIDPVTFEITPNGTVKKVFTNKAMTGTISIVKHSADGKLEGWKFRVYGTALTGQKYDKTFTTDALGNITISNLRIGNYTVEEVTKGVVGYITPDSKDVVVEYDKTSTLDFTNIPIGNVHVTKVDKDYPDNKLTGAEFTVYETDGITEIGKLSEISTGEYQLNDLQYGDYLLKETKAPTNYVLDEEYYEFSISTAGATVNVDTAAGKGFENDAMTGTISIVKHSADGKLEGWKFRVYGTALTGQKYDKTFVTDKDGKITVADLRIGNYTVEEVTTGVVGYITPDSQNVAVEYDKTSTLDFTNIPIGNVHVTKIDKDYPDNKLAGAEFTVYKADKKTVVGKLTEISTGEYQLNDLQYGDYFLKETKAPKNFVLDNNFYAFSIREAGATVNVETAVGKGFENDAMTGTISIVKHSADGKLEGWKFRVYGTALTGQKYDKTFVTDKDGKITVADLRIGNYTVEEVTKGVVGYITPDSQNIAVEYDKTSTLEFTNIPIGNVYVTKIDKGYPDNKLTGAEFTVYKADKKTVVGKLSEISTGEYQLNDLQYGDYFLKETKAPKNFVLDNNFYAFSIREAGATVNVETAAGKGFENDAMTGTISIVKHSADGVLSGWKFRVYGTALTGQKYDKTFTTNKDGKITVADLRIGNYTVEEVTTGVVGYITPDSKDVVVEYDKTSTLDFTNIPIGNVHVTNNFYAFSIREAGATVNVETAAGKGFENDAMTGTISIVKHSADGVLSGWKFRVYGTALTGQKYDKTFVTDKDGKITVADLRIGNYTVEEVTTGVVGYITPDSQNVAVEYDKTSTLEFTNIPIGNVHVTKIDKDYPDNKLTGAEFTVYKADKKTVVGKLTEISTGEYQLNDLQYGDYFLKETKAPKNFVRDVNFYYFQIVNDGETVEVSNDELGKGTFINAPQKGEIKIVKTSYDNKVEGIHFEVTGTTYTGQTFKKTYTTDKNGIIRINDLRAGEYTIHEVKDEASAGYLLPDDKQLTIDRDGATLVAEMHNSKLPDNPPTGAGEDSFMQTAVTVISAVMMSAAVVLVFPLSKRKKRNR